MTRHTGAQIPTHALGTVGLLLMLVVAHLVPPAYEPQTSLTGRLRGIAARRAIDGVAMIGWFFDHMPPYRRTGGGAGHRDMRATHATA